MAITEDPKRSQLAAMADATALSDVADAQAPPVDAERGQAVEAFEPSQGLNPSERRLLSDLFAIVSEHAADSAVEIDRARVQDAFVFACEHHADQRRKSGEDFIVHPVGVARICASMRLDTETLCAALLHDTVEDTSASIEEVRERFGEDISKVVDGVTAAMADFAPDHVRPAQKCMMRIYRDTRFSNDKTPYKNQVAAWWSRHGLEKTSGGGFYFQLAANELTIAAGVYMPEREQLAAIRSFLLLHHEELRALLTDKKLRRLFTPDHGEMLSQPPKGFPKDHPAMDLLKCRQWAVFARLPAEEALEPTLVRNIAAHFRAAAPLVSLLNQPMASAPEEKRPPLFGLY